MGEVVSLKGRSAAPPSPPTLSRAVGEFWNTFVTLAFSPWLFTPPKPPAQGSAQGSAQIVTLQPKGIDRG